MAIPKNNNNYNNHNNQTNNQNSNYNNYNNNYNNQNNNYNNQNNSNYKKYNNLYIYVPSFCVNFESQFAVSIKNILPKNLGFWISKSRVYNTKEYDDTINVLTLSIDMDKNVTLDTQPKSEIKPNQLIQAYQVFMSKLSDVFAHEEYINNFLKDHYDFHNKNVIEQQIIYNKMISWKQAMEINQEKQAFYASKQNNNQIANNQSNNIEVVDINNLDNQAPQQATNNNNNINNNSQQPNNNSQENQSNTVIDLDNLGNL